MRKLLPLLLLVLFISSCSNYGKRMKVNDKIEIYLKGDNITDADGKKLGDYLTTMLKDATNEISFQLSKDKELYVVRMVVDEKKFKEDKTLDESFYAFQTLLETQVFTSNKVKFIVTDDTFKDLKAYQSTQ